MAVAMENLMPRDTGATGLLALNHARTVEKPATPPPLIAVSGAKPDGRRPHENRPVRYRPRADPPGRRRLGAGSRVLPTQAVAAAPQPSAPPVLTPRGRGYPGRDPIGSGHIRAGLAGPGPCGRDCRGSDAIGTDCRPSAAIGADRVSRGSVSAEQRFAGWGRRSLWLDRLCLGRGIAAHRRALPAAGWSTPMSRSGRRTSRCSWAATHSATGARSASGPCLTARRNTPPAISRPCRSTSVSTYAAALLPTLRVVPGAPQVLRDWDGAMTENAPQPLIFSAWMQAFQQAVLARANIPIWAGAPVFEFVPFVLSPEGASWCGGDCAPLLKSTLDSTMAVARHPLRTRSGGLAVGRRASGRVRPSPAALGPGTGGADHVAHRGAGRRHHARPRRHQ